jgi:hypothetical protein
MSLKYNLIKLGVETTLLITEGLLGLLTMVALTGVGYMMFQLALSVVE